MENKIVIITGANKGVGFEISKLLIDNGYDVVSLSRTKPNLNCEHFFCDLSDHNNLKDTIEKVILKYSRIDFFINNAASFLEKELLDISSDELDKILKINLSSPIFLVKSLVPLMINNGFGKIINISSTAALSGKLNQSAYCATKHGLLGFFRSVSMELKDYNIHVHNICPGGINTDFTKGFDVFEELKNQKLIDKKEIATMVHFLMSQSSDIEIGEIQINRYKKK